MGRLVDARNRLRQCVGDHPFVQRLLMNTKPGDAVVKDYGFGEPTPPADVWHAIDHFDRMLRNEDGIFRQLAKSDMDAALAKRKFA
jgi:hypothetical protein